MLSKRLSAIKDFVSNEDKIIDVGCDHALLDIFLVKNGIVDSLYVSDVSENALNNAIDNIEKNNLSDKIIPLLGNGLSVINKSHDVDTLIISGMGSATILEIVSNKKISNIKKCIFQSNNNHEILRTYMIHHGFSLESERVVYEDKKYYVTMLFKRGKCSLKDYEISYGIHNNIDYYNYLLKKEKRIVKNIPLTHFLIRKKHRNNIKKINKCLEKIRQI